MSDNRTHTPTAKRRQQARSEGRVVASHLFGGALSWLAMAALVFSSATWLISTLQFEPNADAALQSLDGNGLRDFVSASLLHVGAHMLIPLGIILGVSILGRLAQVGFLWLPTRIVPDVSRLNPRQNLTSLFSAEKIFQAGRGLVLIICALVLIGWGIVSQQEQLLQSLIVVDAELHVMRLLASWGIRLGGLLVLFAFIDYACEWNRFETKLMMSQEEMRAEVKAVEGNTQVASERNAMHRAMMNSRQQTS